jgi:[acyl-carrier-protein] S-malonyltransferase
MNHIAYVFPGQGSQSVGMMSAWEDHQSLVNEVFGEAADALGYDLWNIVSEGPEGALNQTEITQPAMLCSGVASWRVAQAADLPPATMMAGHSLGEYTALVCAGSMELASAVRLVAERGRLMQAAVPADAGAMAAIIGLEDDDVVAACASVEQGVVEAVNFNAPGQVVIAGERAAVDQAMAKAKGLGAKRALPLPVSVPSHCSLMKDAARQLAEELESVALQLPEVPVVHNQNAAIAESVEEIRERLQMQLYQPVKWVASVQFMHRRGIGTLIECGPGKVLTGLARRIERSLQAFAIYDADSLDTALDSTQFSDEE